MPDILVSDIALLESQELSDFDTGGGPPRYNAIVPDNQVRNVFQARYSIHEIYGNVQLRQVFSAVRSLNAASSSMRVLIARPPSDPDMSLILFTVEPHGSYNPAIRNYVENVLALAGIAPYRVLYDQMENSRILQMWQQLEQPIPTAGTVVALSVEHDDYDPFVQVVRITSIASIREEVFYDGEITFTARVITANISPPLEQDFFGDYPNLGKDDSPTVIRETTPIDTTTFYGCAALLESASTNDITISVPSIFLPIVPTSYDEEPVVDVIAGLRKANLVQAGTTPMSVSMTVNLGNGQSTILFFPQPFMPGSLTLTYGGITYVDAADGSLTLENGQLGLIRGVANYAGGNVTISPSSAVSGTLAGSALPASALNDSCVTAYLPVTVDTVGESYTFSLRPLPAPGTITIDYYAAGQWLRVTDAGGQSALSGEGTGSVSYLTGSGVLSCARQPDPGTWIIFSWGISTQALDRSGQTTGRPYIVRSIAGLPANEAIKPGTITWAWTANSVAKTATANAAGVISGDATGNIEYSRNKYTLRPALLPDANTLTATFDTVITTTETLNIAAVAHDVTGTLASASVAGSVSIKFFSSRFEGGSEVVKEYVFMDGGDGKLYFEGSNGTRTQRGTIVNATGVFTATVEAQYSYDTYTPSQSDPIGAVLSMTGGNWTPTTTYEVYAGSVTATYQVNGTAQQSGTTDAFTISSLSLDVSPQYLEPLVPSSLRFTLAGKTWVDVAGVLKYDVDPASGAGTTVGIVEHLSRVATLTTWPAGGATTVVVQALNTTRGNWSVQELFFRTPGAPIRRGSLFVRANETDGSLISATANSDGVIAGTGFEAGSLVNSDYGMVKLFFTNPVNPITVFHNVTILRYSALNPDIIGLDPTQLPLDGRVQCFRADQIVAIHETFEGAIAANPPVGGSTINTGKTNAHLIYVVDVNNDKVPITEFTTNLSAGTLTFVANPDFTGLTGPYRWVARVMDERRAAKVYANGQIQLDRGLSRNFSTDAFISSELIIDGVMSRIGQKVELNTWDNDFNNRTGSPPVNGGILNLSSYPATVTNRHAMRGWYAIKFDASDRVDVRHETRGVLVVDHVVTSGPLNIPNPDTSGNALVIPAAAFGIGGWVTGNTILIFVEDATYPIDLALCCLPGEHDIAGLDYVTLEILADVEP